ncbi:MAG: carboxypeptidase regulatory-like domain-containing protein [Bacteroidetes bacterium]|nr:MAG: carboxypeptidase regulatory-like domain-containing protein [Bacteroidota bacterium]
MHSKTRHLHILLSGVLQITLLVFFCSAFSFGQTTIRGTVLNEQSKPIADASITLMLARDSTVVAFNFSNANGEFSILYHGNETDLLLGVRGFNIKQHIQKIEIDDKTITVFVKEEAIELEEFSLKAPKIWGSDTINYSVGAFRDSTDLVIGDVLKKLPGITVRESGRIEYKGKPISNFYIENMDMLQGRYGIATNSISATDIATVQVFENHQPIKALKDIAFSDDAAINLILRPDARGIYSSMADLGGGSNENFLWNNSLTAMYFSKSRQHLTSLKTNNTGNDLEQEFQSFYNSFSLPPAGLSNLVMPAPPPINKSRYLFNEAYGGTVNNLFKTKNDAELTLNLNGYRDIDDRLGFNQTRYMIPGADTLTITEGLNSHTHKLNFEGGIGYKKNTPQSYLNTLTQAAISQNESEGYVIGDDIITQSDKNQPVRLTQTIHWVRRSNSEKQPGIEFNSRSYYRAEPYSLDVSPGTFADEFNQNEPYITIRQKVDFNSFQTQNRMMFLLQKQWKSIFINPVLLFSMEHQSLNTDIFTAPLGNDFTLLHEDFLQNDMKWMRMRTGLGLNFTYRKRDFNILLSAPVQYQHIALNDLQNQEEDPKSDKIIFLPYINFTYDLSTRWQVSGNWFWYNHNPDLKNLYPGLILQDYRTLTHYDNKLSDTYGQQSRLLLSYRNVIHFLFANVEVNYNRYRNDVMYAQQFEGSAMRITRVELENTGDYLSVVGRLGKGFDWKKLSFNAEGSWGSGSTPQLRQESLIRFNNQGLNANVTLSMEPLERFVLANKTSTSRMTMRAGSEEQSDPLINFINATSMSYSFTNGLMFSLGFEYYHMQDKNRQQDFFLLDAQWVYTIRRIRFALHLNNVLNAENYIYSYYGNLNSYYSEYRIRPASIHLSARFKLY